MKKTIFKSLLVNLIVLIILYVGGTAVGYSEPTKELWGDFSVKNILIFLTSYVLIWLPVCHVWYTTLNKWFKI